MLDREKAMRAKKDTLIKKSRIKRPKKLKLGAGKGKKKEKRFVPRRCRGRHRLKKVARRASGTNG